MVIAFITHGYPLCRRSLGRVWLHWLVIILCAVLFLNWPQASIAATKKTNFQTGVKAYLKGNYTAAIKLWKPLATAGDAPAQFNLGVLYAQGLGIKQDLTMAATWYRRSARKGYAPAQFNLGEAYYGGAGVAVDVRKTIHWWTTAAKQQHSKAQYNLGYLYLLGKGVKKDRKQAIFWFQQAAAQDDPYAVKMLNSLGIRRAAKITATKPMQLVASKKTGKSISSSSQSAVTKNPGASNHPPIRPSSQSAVVATVATKGSAIPEPGKKLRSTAKEQQNRTVVSRAGKGVQDAAWLQGQNPKYYTVQLLADRSQRKVLAYYARYRWDRPVAVFASIKAGKRWYKLVYGVFNGRALVKKVVAAMPEALRRNQPWIRSLASVQREMVTSIPAKQTLAKQIPATQAKRAPVPSGQSKTHKAVPAIDDQLPPLQRAQKYFQNRDYAQAYKTWLPLAQAGVAEAQYNIGFLYEAGWGVKASSSTAASWYQRAAQSGHAKAQFNLALLYLHGNGVEADTNMANYWLQSAADGGDRRAELYLKDSRKPRSLSESR